MDRILAVIIIFIGLMVITAAILAMGAVPKIFQNAEVITETKNETKNQTELIIKQFQRENNTTQKILSNQNKSLTNQVVMIKDMQKSIKQNYIAIEQNHNISDYILNISNEHKQVAKDHDLIQAGVENTTKQTYDLLKRADERNFQATIMNKEILMNLTKELNTIKTIHKDILDILKQQNKTN